MRRASEFLHIQEFSDFLVLSLSEGSESNVVLKRFEVFFILQLIHLQEKETKLNLSTNF